MADDDDDVECCMTQAEINAKHIAIRGSLAYKYPPKESRCREKCGLADMSVIDNKSIRKYVDHGCFLAIGHKGECQFSSECKVNQMRLQ
jgi:hypothetical protein